MKIGFSVEILDKEFYAETKPNKILTIMTILTYCSAFSIINDSEEIFTFKNDIFDEYFNKNKHKTRFKMLSKACSGSRRQKIFELAQKKDNDTLEGSYEVLLNIVIDNLIKSQNPEYKTNNELFEVTES